MTDASASADQSILVTLGRDQDVRVWDPGGSAAGRGTACRPAHRGLFGLATSADGATIAAGDGVGTVHVLRSGRAPPSRRRATPAGSSASGSSRLVAWSPAMTACTVRVWNVKTCKVLSASAALGLADHERRGRRPTARPWRPPARTVSCVCTRRAASGKPDGKTARVPVGVNKVVFAPSGAPVAAYDDGQVRFWNVRRRTGAEATCRRRRWRRRVQRCGVTRRPNAGRRDRHRRPDTVGSSPVPGGAN